MRARGREVADRRGQGRWARLCSGPRRGLPRHEALLPLDGGGGGAPGGGAAGRRREDGEADGLRTHRRGELEVRHRLIFPAVDAPAIVQRGARGSSAASLRTRAMHVLSKGHQSNLGLAQQVLAGPQLALLLLERLLGFLLGGLAHGERALPAHNGPVRVRGRGGDERGRLPFLEALLLRPKALLLILKLMLALLMSSAHLLQALIEVRIPRQARQLLTLRGTLPLGQGPLPLGGRSLAGLEGGLEGLEGLLVGEESLVLLQLQLLLLNGGRADRTQPQLLLALRGCLPLRELPGPGGDGGRVVGDNGLLLSKGGHLAGQGLLVGDEGLLPIEEPSQAILELLPRCLELPPPCLERLALALERALAAPDFGGAACERLTLAVLGVVQFFLTLAKLRHLLLDFHLGCLQPLLLLRLFLLRLLERKLLRFQSRGSSSEFLLHALKAVLLLTELFHLLAPGQL
mmetsp:Transcript_30798/g.88466  ORF Transcript_30798/g.88466 Transcript_30798/m.88466 type:complete len:460 (+) Transcript_30798:313-1692(+)